MTILEKPLTVEDFKSVINNVNMRRANLLIKSLNDRIRRGEIRISRWSGDLVEVKVLAIVGKTFRQAGWGGVQQKKNEINENYYSIELILPQCMCNKEDSEDTCEICKGE